MSYRDAIPDIVPGSIWLRTDGGPRARVIAAASRHVVYRDAEGAIRQPSQLLHENAFRATFLPLYGRREMKSQFSMSIANLGEFRAYWIGDPGRFLARSVSCQRKFSIPARAIEIGLYVAPFHSDSFLADLDCVLAAIDHEATRERALSAAI